MNPEQQNELNKKLLHACSRGNLNAVKSLLKEGAFINIRIKTEAIEINPLYLTLKNKHFKVAAYLIKNGADMYAYGGENMMMNQFIIDKQDDIIRFLVDKMRYNLNVGDKLSRVPLHIACREKQSELARYFLRNRANINAQDSIGNTALSKATYAESEETVKVLLEHGADPNIPNKYGNTPIFSAVFKNNKKLLFLLYQYKADINFLNNQGRNCLWDALKYKYFNLFYGLLCLGANAMQPDNQGNPILHHCMFKDDYHICKIVLDCFAAYNRSLKNGEKPINLDQPDTYYYSALQKTIKHQDFKKANLLLEYGADIEWRTPDYQRTALLNTAYLGNLEGLQYCIQQKANIHAKDDEGCTALMLSIKKGHNHIVQYLINQGVDINSVDNKGQTALFFSILKNNPEATQILLNNGINPHITDTWGRNVCWPIIKMNNVDLLKQFLDLGIDKNIQDNHGETLLHFAVYQENLPVIRILLEKQVNITLQNHTGETALDLAYKLNDRLKTEKTNMDSEEYARRSDTLRKIIKHLKVADYQHQQTNTTQSVATTITRHQTNPIQKNNQEPHINE
ncbi:MAG: ankyrin repeat domain-containing protein [Alphaproteobacteria bacterium]|nr:ankyrin repeat domain-containing protein [Alphaproteobacteria bacterium]